MVATVLGIVSEAREEQSLNALPPIEVTELGTLIDLSAAQPKNVPEPIVVSALGHPYSAADKAPPLC